jgi:DNA mismatch repair ATPase MutS
VYWDDADVAHRELGIIYTNRKTMSLLSAGVPLQGIDKHVQVS